MGNESEEKTSENAGWCSRLCWWSPAQDTLSVDFCNETNIHGFKFLGQDNLHLTERIFWLVGFLCSLATSIYLIYGMFERYSNAPVIVTFQSSELQLDMIPFPAVTICDMNKISKSRVLELQINATSSTLTAQERKSAQKQLKFIKNACKIQTRFAKHFGFAFNRGTHKEINDKETNIDGEEFTQKEITGFLVFNTIPCDQLIRLCMFGREKMNCAEVFTTDFTNYGKCCTFNMMPLPLFLKNPKNPNAHPYENPAFGDFDVSQIWPPDEIDKWRQWNYDKGFVLNETTSRPLRQKRAGLQYGLSILIDPNTDDYYCPASDSMGVRYILHTPIKTAHVMEFSSVAELGKEIFVNVHPEMTFADEDIRSVTPEIRKCHFGKEKTLRFFNPYTGSNCVDECHIDYLQKHCNCTPFYMMRDSWAGMCDSDPNSNDYNCSETVMSNLQPKLKKYCPKCLKLCEDITYNHETTIAKLQDGKILWGDPDPSVQETPEWANHTMTLLHIFFGAESTVPKYRKRMYGFVDLLANMGGILGLCLGFSILSAVEVVYFFTLRAFWKFWKKREIKRQADEPAMQTPKFDIWSSGLFQRKSSKVIALKVNNDISAYTNDTGNGNAFTNKVYSSPFAR